jgi:hypothetical protein
MFAMYAHQGVAGTPPWWWVAVGATAVTASSAAGFAVGVYWPTGLPRRWPRSAVLALAMSAADRVQGHQAGR